MSEGSLSPIIVKYERLLDEDPRSRSFAPLAEAYRQVGLVDKAFDVLKKGLRYNPEYLLGYLTLALCYQDKNEYGLSYSTLKPLISSNRDNIKLQRVFAECAKKTNNLEEALDSYKYLLFLNPRDAEIAKQVALLEEELHEDAVYSSKSNSQAFNVDDLHPNPEDDKEIDNWVQVNLSTEEEDEIEEDNWSVNRPEESLPSESEKLVFEKDDLSENHEDIEFIHDELTKEINTKESQNERDHENDREDNLISFEAPASKEKDATPVITHTLVDIYLKQGHYLKAKEILDKIIEVGPSTDETKKKLSEINELIAAEGLGDSTEEPEQEKNEGRDDLMAAFDKSFGEEEATNDVESEEEVRDFSGLIEELDAVMADYLTELKSKYNAIRD